jgi:DNA invertase Pin-like site-specific DNA recombinase
MDQSVRVLINESQNEDPKRSVGYARISTVQQDLTRQLQALKVEGCAKVFSDAASGKMAGRSWTRP